LIEVPENTVVFGGPRFTWLNALKNSARNCNETRSFRAVFFKSERSTSARPGPRSVPLPTLPKVPAVGSVKAEGSNHWFCFRKSTEPENDGFQFGRSGFRVFPSPDRFDPERGVNGNPLNSEVIPFSCQPEINFATPRTLLELNGNSKCPE